MTGASAAGGTAAFEPYPPQGRGGLDPRRPGLFADRLAHFRRAYLAQPDCRALGSLQILDLERVKARLGRRWAELLPKVLLNVEGCIAHRLGPDELYLVVDETTVWILALGERRAEVDRRGRLIAADITERLLGVLPGGSAVGVRTLLFDFDEGLRSVAGVNGLRERVQRQMKRQGEAEARAFAEHAQQLVAFYRPILSLKAPLVVGYRAFVRLAGPDGTLEMPGIACPEQAAGIFDASVDGWLAERLATELVRTAAGGGRALLVLPVRYATLADPALRGPWLERLGPLPKDAVRRFAVELIDLPPALPRVRIAELATRLAGRAGHLMLRSPAEAEAVRGLAGEGVFAVSVNVTDFDPADPDTSTTLTGVARACAAAGLRSLAVRVGSAAMAEVARAAGIDYLSGDACLPALRAPGRVVGLATG